MRKMHRNEINASTQGPKKNGMNIINGSIEDIAVYGTCRFYENVGFAYENPKKTPK